MCQGTTPWARWWRHDNVEKTHKLKGKGQPFNEEKMKTEEATKLLPNSSWRQPGKEGRGRNCLHLILYNKEKVDPEDMSKMYNNSQIEMVATWRGQDVSETHQHHGTKNDCKPAPRRGGGLHRARGGDDQCNSKNAILKGTEWEMQQNSKFYNSQDEEQGLWRTVK